MRYPSLHQLELFCRVVQRESMARAAEEMRLAPSSVSMQIRSLEERYGTRLLVRGPRRVTLTEAGTALYARAVELLSGLDMVEREISQLESSEGGVLRFAASRTIGSALVQPVLRKFERLHPGVQIFFTSVTGSRAASVEVLEGRAEFALAGRAESAGTLCTEPLVEEPLVVVAAPGHPLTAVARATVRDVADHPLLLRHASILEGERVLELVAEAGGAPQVREFASTEALKAAVAAGDGVAVLPRSTVLGSLGRGELVECAIDGMKVCRPIYLIRPAAVRLSSVAQSFLGNVAYRVSGAEHVMASA